MEIECSVHIELFDLVASAPYDGKVGVCGSSGPKLKLLCFGLSMPSFRLPPRSMVGQLTLDQHIGVRIPGGQPIPHLLEPFRTSQYIENRVFSLT